MKFYMLDRVTHMEVGQSIEGVKCWSLSDDVFGEHFPGFPIVPGVLIIESMAQLVGALIEESYQQKFPEDEVGVYAILTIVHKAKFKKFAMPGDRLELKGKLGTLDTKMGNGSASVYIEGKFAAKADLSFVLLPRDKFPNDLLEDQRKNFTQILFKGKEFAEGLTR